MDPWAVLGVPPGSSDRAIRDAYLRLSRKRHPDMGGTDAAMQELNAAYQAALAYSAPPPGASYQPPPPPPPNWSPHDSQSTPLREQSAARAPRKPRKPFYRRKRYWIAAFLFSVLVVTSGVTDSSAPAPKPDIYQLIGRCVLLENREIVDVVPCAAAHDAWVVEIARLPEFCPPIADDHLAVENYLICLNREK